MVEITKPKENFPEIGTVANPVFWSDGEDVFVCYQASYQDSPGNAVVKFKDVIDFRLTPENVDALDKFRYPVQPWAFCEVIGGEETQRWRALKPRFFIISFRDVMIEVIFDKVSAISFEKGSAGLLKTLSRTLASETGRLT